MQVLHRIVAALTEHLGVLTVQIGAFILCGLAVYLCVFAIWTAIDDEEVTLGIVGLLLLALGVGLFFVGFQARSITAEEEGGVSQPFKNTLADCSALPNALGISVCRSSHTHTPRCRAIDYCVFDPHRWTKQATIISRRTPGPSTCNQAIDQARGDFDPQRIYETTAEQRLAEQMLGNSRLMKGLFVLNLTPAMVRASLDLALENQEISIGEHRNRLVKAQKALFSAPIRSVVLAHGYSRPIYLFGAEPAIQSEFEGKGRLVYMSPELATGLERQRLGLLSFEDRVCEGETGYELPISWSDVHGAETRMFFNATVRFMPRLNSPKEAVLGFLKIDIKADDKPIELLLNREGVARIPAAEKSAPSVTATTSLNWETFSKVAAMLGFSMNVAKLATGLVALLLAI